MIRPFTLITAIMFILSGAYLFAVKHRAQVLDDQISAAAQGTRMDEQRIRVLQAQWALEAGPGRLAQLSAEFTKLQPMQPSQLVTLASLGSVLPAPGSAVPEQNPALPALPVPAPDAAVAQNAPPAPPAAPTASVPVRTASVQAEAPEVHDTLPARLAENDSPARLEHVETLLHSLPAQRHLHTHHPASLYAEARPSYPAPQMASALAPQAPEVQGEPIGAQVMSVRAVATVSAPPPPPMDGGSMLGMAQTMSPNGSSN